MVVASLRTELGQHLARNPDPQAPDGFRDRFDQLVEHHETETDPARRSAIEAQLRQIRREAEAAANAGRRSILRPMGLALAAVTAAVAATAVVLRFLRR